MVVTSSELEDGIAQAIERRRNFAIISHPDAGKTTLTEKLLLYGGAIQEAGAVKAKRTVETRLEPLPFTVARWVTGGWDALEKVGRLFNTFVVKDRWQRPVLLFKNQWNLEQNVADHPELQLSPIALPPTSESS